MLVMKQGLSTKQWGKIYLCCVRPVLLYCCETWELTVADETRLHGVEDCMIRMCRVRLIDRVSTVLDDKMGVLVKIEDAIFQIRLQCYGHAMNGDIISQIREIIKVEITGKRKKIRPRKSWEECVRKDLEQYGLRREDEHD